MGVAELEVQVLALHRGAIADAVDFELLLVALGDAGDQLGDERAIGPPHRARALGLALGSTVTPPASDLGGDVVVQDELQGALGALHLDGLALDIGGDARRDGDRLFSDT